MNQENELEHVGKVFQVKFSGTFIKVVDKFHRAHPSVKFGSRWVNISCSKDGINWEEKIIEGYRLDFRTLREIK